MRKTDEEELFLTRIYLLTHVFNCPLGLLSSNFVILTKSETVYLSDTESEKNLQMR